MNKWLVRTIVLSITCVFILYRGRHSICMINNLFDTIVPNSDVVDYLREPALVRDKNYSGLTPLHLSLMYGEYTRAQALIASGADINAREPEQQNTPLHLITLGSYVKGGLALVQLILDNYADVQLRQMDGNNALHLTNSLVELPLKMAVIRELVLYGCDINARNNRGWTLLHLAIARRDPDFLVKLFELCGGIMRLDLPDELGRNAYTYARDINHSDLAPLIPTENLRYPSGYDALGLTELQRAVIKNDCGMMGVLMGRGASVNQKSANELGNTALHVSILYEHAVCAEKLIKRGAQIIADNQGNTPLHLAGKIKRMRKAILLAGLLMQVNPQIVNKKNGRGQTIVHISVLTNNAPLLEWLVAKYGPYIDYGVRDANGETAKEIAVRIARPELAAMLR